MVGGTAGDAPPAMTSRDVGRPGNVRALEMLVVRLRRRYRLAAAARSVSRWGWVGPALAVGLLLYARRTPVEGEVAAAGLVAGVWILAVTAAALLGPLPLDRAARRADHDLALKDRLATALAFGDGEPSAMIGLQRADALRVAATIDPAKAVRIRWDRRRLVAGAAIAAAATALALLPNPQREQLAARKVIAAAARAEAERAEAHRAELRADAALTAEDRAALDAALAELAERLREDGSRADDALAAVTDAEREIGRLRDPSASQRSNAADRLAEQLADLAATSAPRKQADTATEAAALADLASTAAARSARERARLAGRLEELAESTAATVPGAAESLRDLASALRSGSREAGMRAAASSQAAITAAREAGSAARAADALLSDLQRGRQALSAAASGTALSASTGGEGAAGADDREGAGSAAGREGQGAGDGDGGGDGSAAGPEAAGSSAQAGGGFSPGGSGGRGSDARAEARGEGDAYAPTGEALSGRRGESPFVFAPSPGDESGGRPEFVPSRDGPADDGATQSMRESRAPAARGRALVPYRDVFSRYRDAAAEALERETIPARLRPYVQRYFEQLEPQ